MKNKKTLFIILIVLLVISLLSGCLFMYSKSFDYDNETSIFTATDKRYSEEQIDKLEEEISFSNMYTDFSLLQFKLRFQPECIRKTPFGYYAALVHEEGSLCFVFWTFDNKIHSIYRTNGFISSKDYRGKIVLGQSTFEEIRGTDFDFFGYPYSKKVSTAHICTDGILVVDYDDNWVAESIDFYSNEELTTTNEDFLKLVPYILPEDKKEARDKTEGNIGTVRNH